MARLAILQLADQGPAESTALMLRAAGYDVRLPSEALRRRLRAAGLDTVLSPADLTRRMGYDPVDIPEAPPEAMDACDLYADVKAQRNYAPLVRRWPRLAGRVLWVRVNGGRPEHVIKPNGEDCGDEVNPPCPVLTPNLWYADPGPWSGRAYACWPPFCRQADYYPAWGRPGPDGHGPPVCLVHNLTGWGYGALVDGVRALGVRCYGAGSPDGLVPHREVPALLASALCVVHLKSNDAPGYSLYEALAAACPVVCTRRLIWRCRMGGLLVPGETCLAFDRETHDPLGPRDVEACLAELAGHLGALRDPETNARIGRAGRRRLLEVMWSEESPADVASLREFLARHFP